MCYRRKELPGDKAWVKSYLKKKKKIYLVACWARWGVLECIYAGGKIYSARVKGKVPYIWQYYDANGTVDLWVRMPITSATSGTIKAWTFDKATAEKIAQELNNYEGI